MYQSAQKTINFDYQTSGKQNNIYTQDSARKIIERTISFYLALRDQISTHSESTGLEYQSGGLDNYVSGNNRNIELMKNEAYQAFVNRKFSEAKSKGVYLDKTILRMIQNGVRINSDFIKFILEEGKGLGVYTTGNVLGNMNWLNFVTTQDVDKYFEHNRPTDLEAAIMANHVYEDNQPELEGGWRVSRRAIDGVDYNTSTGLHSNLYEKIDDLGNIIAYAYVTAGTEDFTDIIQDVEQLKGMSLQYYESNNNAKLISQDIGDMELFMIGHSLGGGLALVNSRSTGREAITFNPAGLSFYTKLFTKKHQLSDLQKDATNLIVEGEPLDMGNQVATGRNSGKQIFLKPDEKMPTLDRHSINTAIDLLREE